MEIGGGILLKISRPNSQMFMLGGVLVINVKLSAGNRGYELARYYSPNLSALLLSPASALLNGISRDSLHSIGQVD